MSEFGEKRERIRNLMEYAVPEGSLDEALDLLDIYRDDRIALDLLHEFYAFLPEAKNDLVREIRLACRRQGVFLLAAMTRESGYFYLVSSEGIEFQGTVAEGMYDQDVLDFFGYSGREQFQAESSRPGKFQVYEPMGSDEDLCPACHAATGELHELGCPVELCPWCGGQLVYCSCRFEKLEVESLSSEKDLVRFEEILNEQGRIPYSPEQRPSFADEGPGVIIE
ncbi:MAG: hypothetical protein M8357_07700 [Desulfobulbaceae bacterium]|nr:hypothetical protein [Desulfobulbaceae bacterium]